MWIQSQGQKDPLEEETATHKSILAWRSQEELSGLQSIQSQRVGHNWSNLACVCASNLRKLFFYSFGVVLLSQLPYYKFFFYFFFLLLKAFCLILMITERFMLPIQYFKVKKKKSHFYFIFCQLLLHIILILY